MSSNNQTKYERLGNIFGAPLPTLDPEFLPKKADVIRHWMSLFDTARTSRILSPAKKSEVKSQVISAVVSIWKSKSKTICCEKNLARKYDRLIEEADPLGSDPRCKKNDRIWIEQQWKLKKFNSIFDIGDTSSTPTTPKTPLKRKSEEMVCTIMNFQN